MRPLLTTVFAAAFCAIGVATSPASAQDTQRPASKCLALAQAAPGIQYASLSPLIQPAAYTPAQGKAESVRIRFVGHSTYLIESPEGLRIATDYAGWAGQQDGQAVIPDVVTMNRAHSSHWTASPNPAIGTVLPGWGETGGPADHFLRVRDVVIRSLPTDIRGFREGRVAAGNSIFVFETAGLCIGHLGHLHQVLNQEDLTVLGQLDIVMVAVDGRYTMSRQAVAETLGVIRARLVLPMHYFGERTLQEFLLVMQDTHTLEISDGPEFVISTETMPDEPTVLVVPQG